jgi:hypothetical protein
MAVPKKLPGSTESRLPARVGPWTYSLNIIVVIP